MTKIELLECIDFFNRLSIKVTDISTQNDLANGNKVVQVEYHFDGKSYLTNPLYYEEITGLDNVRYIDSLHKYFGDKVYWLDIEKHQWPKGSGESDLDNLVINDIASPNDEDFKSFLFQLANNDQTGYIQLMTRDGRPAQYYHNLENNNHWHDLVLFIKKAISEKGKEVPKQYFEHLIFNWDKGKRTSLNAGVPYKIITDLYKNLKLIQPDMNLNEIKILLNYKKQIILQGPPGTGKTYTAKDIAEQLIFNTITADKKKQKENLESTDQFKLIQFHPAYSYEDFVRGISAESNDGIVEYKTENKILAAFAKSALDNFKDSQKDIKLLSEESLLNENFREFTEFIIDKIEENGGKYILEGTTTYLKQVEEDCFRYTGDNWKSILGNRMIFEDIKEMYRQGIKERQEIKKMSGVSGLAIQHASYFMKVLDLFYKFMEGRDNNVVDVAKIIEKPFVLIIDEINRANLPAVLGELIYALEYRGDSVESMYGIDGDRTLILPPNLYIIGTMNTADRSVGHIDYAIRRRFAFVNIHPSNEVIKNIVPVANGLRDIALKLYTDVGLFFTKEKMTADFKIEDVQLGHSYFLAQSSHELWLKLEYEIKPLLKEYIKDGILISEKDEDGVDILETAIDTLKIV